MRTQGIELRGARERTGLTSAAPAQRLAQDYRATATTGLCHGSGCRIGTLAVSVLRIAQISSRI